MGGPGSGGYKNAPGDTETHSEWAMVAQDPNSTQKLAQVRCKHCGREMAQHTSRQRIHLLQCRVYLDTMKTQGLENTITRQAADPNISMMAKPRARLSAVTASRYSKLVDVPFAIRVQALALAEASISYDRIEEITGVAPKVTNGLRSLARERGYDPQISMQLKEDYVGDPTNTAKPRGRPKKRKPEEELDDPEPLPSSSPNPSARAPPGFLAANNLPPGNWNFMTPATGYSMT